nr:hypothetical protein Iba_chr05eCG2150 [Ipomoea batatas]
MCCLLINQSCQKQVHSHVQFRVQLGTWTFLLFDHPVPQMSDAWTGQQPTLTVFICLTVKLVTKVPRVGFTITCLSVSLQISGLGVLHIDRATICSLSISDALWIEKLPNHAWLLPTVSPFSHLGSGILALKPIQALSGSFSATDVISITAIAELYCTSSVPFSSSTAKQSRALDSVMLRQIPGLSLAR